MRCAWVVLIAACSSAAAPQPPPTRVVAVTVSLDATLAVIDDRFLSVAVDQAQVDGGKFWTPGGTVDPIGGGTRVPPYDFSRPKLRRLARELAPSRVRVGGTESDKVYYDMSDAPPAAPPSPFVGTITKAQIDGLFDFAKAVDFEVVFTLNAGPGARDLTDVWTVDNASRLLDYVKAKDYRVALWELGNEVNGFPVSIKFGYTITPQQLAKDILTARALLDAKLPGSKLSAPSSAFWPVSGEVIPFTNDLLSAGAGASLDVLTWHYYPMHSSRCALATRRASLDTLLDPQTLIEVDHWATEVEGWRDAQMKGKPVWLGETGGAYCGGEPGLSSTFADGFYWLDEMGRMARHGEATVVRQTLSGSDYGLIDDVTLEPRPDYWTSVLWRRLMGTRVLSASTGDPKLFAYAHCTRGGPTGSVTIALLNLDRQFAATFDATSFAPSVARAQLYLLTAPSVDAPSVMLNGRALAAAADGAPPPLDPVSVDARKITLAPASYGFVVLPDANAKACP